MKKTLYLLMLICIYQSVESFAYYKWGALGLSCATAFYTSCSIVHDHGLKRERRQRYRRDLNDFYIQTAQDVCGIKVPQLGAGVVEVEQGIFSLLQKASAEYVWSRGEIFSRLLLQREGLFHSELGVYPGEVTNLAIAKIVERDEAEGRDDQWC